MARYRVLGPVAVEDAGGPVQLGGPKQRAVLAVLLLRLGHVVPEEHLFDLVWGDDPPPSIRGRLQVHVSELRKLLGKDVIVRSGTGYRIGVPPGDLDLSRFEQACARAAAAEPDEAARLLKSALDLWSGPALGGTTPALLERAGQALEERRLVAVEDRLDAELAAGRAGAVVGELRTLVAEHPFRERPHGQLMLALHRGGQTSDALRVFRDVRARLRTELGIDPGAQLTELHGRILAGESVAPEPSPTAPRPAELPSDIAGFAGRLAALAELDEVPVPGVVVVSGAGGVGKSALAVHWAHAARRRFPDGQVHLDLHGFDGDRDPLSADAALAQLLRTLGVPAAEVPAGQADKVRRYRSLLADRTMLVLLDDARDTDQVTPLLPPSGLAVITSRSRLGRLVAAVGARRVPLDVLPDAEAHALVTGMLAPARVAAEPEAVAELIRLCGALPLALRVATANIAGSGGDVAEAVRALAGDRLGELTVDGADGSAVRAAFALSYRALRPEHARVFRALGLLPGGTVTPHAAAALAGLPVADGGRALRMLAAAHLVEHSAHNRFRMHELVRLFAAELVRVEDTEPERDAALDRLTGHYLSTMDSVIRLTGNGLTRIEGELTLVDDHRVDLADEQAAAQWADTEMPAMIALTRLLVVRVPTPATWHLVDMVRKASSDAHRALWSRAAPAMIAAARDHGRDDVAAVVELSLGTAVFRNGDAARGLRLMEAAIESARRAGLTNAEANAEMNLGSALHWTGRLDEAVEHASRAEELHREAGRLGGASAALALLTAVHFDRGDLALGQECGERAVALAAESGMEFWHAAARTELALLLTVRAEFERARTLLHSGLDTMRRIGSQYGQLVSLRAIVELDVLAGKAASVHADAVHCVELADQDGDRTAKVQTLIVLGRVETELGRFDDALDTLEQAKVLADDLGLRSGQVEVRAAIARALAHKGSSTARTVADEAVRLADGSGYRLAEADALTTVTEVEALLGTPDPAPATAAARVWRAAGHVVGQRRVERVLAQPVVGR